LPNYLWYLHDDGLAVNASRRRWEEMLCGLISLLPTGPASVLVDGDEPAVGQGQLQL
jgi:hypothetical protein